MKITLPQTAPQWWSVIIAGAGFAFLGVIESASAVYAFNTANQALKLWGLPLDALIKTAASILAAIVAFGGAIVASAKRGKGKSLAYAVTFLCFAWTAAGFSGFNAWARESATSLAFQQTVEYKDAVAVISGLHGVTDLNSTQYAAKQDALEITKQGEAPTTAHREFGDLVRAVAAIALVWGMAAAFRLPPVKAKAESTEKKARKPRSDKGTKRGPQLVASNA